MKTNKQKNVTSTFNWDNVKVEAIIESVFQVETFKQAGKCLLKHHLHIK